MICSFGSRADNIARKRSPRPEVNPGFYTTWSFPLEVYECFKNKDVCEGDLPETCSTKRYGLLCHDCPTGVYRSGNDCKTCSAQIPILIVLCVVCIGFILAFYFKGNSPLVSEVRGRQIALLVLQQMFAIVQLFALFNTLQTKLPNSSFASKALGATDEVAIRLLIRFKCFFSKWRPACWYWGYVLCVRQQLLTCTLSFFSDDIWAQMFWVIILVFAISVACAFVEPW